MESTTQATQLDPTKSTVVTINESRTGMEWFQWVQDFADKLTFKRILTVLFAGLLATAITVIFENRSAVFQSVYSTITKTEETGAWEISRETQDQLITLVQTSSMIKMASVMDVDLQKNRRVLRFRQLNDPDATEIKRKSATILPQAVFDYNPKNTQHMVGILNNEFVCSPFQETHYQQHFPELAKRMPVLCSVAIPPFYGRFVGILTLGLYTAPTKQELDSLRIEASRLAVEIYLRDVLRKPNTVHK